MFKAVVLVYTIIIAAVAVNGCGTEKIEQLNTQVSALQSENAGLKTKIGEVEKSRNDATAQVATLNAERDQLKKDLETCKPPDKAGDKTTGAQHKNGGQGKETGVKAGTAGKGNGKETRPGKPGKGPGFKPVPKAK